MDQKSLLLLSCLRENSREKLTSISKKTKVPISTLFDLLNELHGKVILQNTVLLNFSELGFHARAQVIFKVDREHKPELMKYLHTHPNVNTIYKVNDGYDLIIETIHRTIKELDHFLEKLNEKFKIEEQQIHYLIDEVKREGFVVR